MDGLGQQALELQLERFFTVWAWSWDTEEQPDFGSHLGGSPSTLPTHRFFGVLIPLRVGRPLHPYYKALASQFEPLDEVLLTQSISFALSPSGLIPSPRFFELRPSPALVQHLRSILPEYVPSDPQPPPDQEPDSNSVKATASNENTSGHHSTGGFALPTIPMPAVNLNMDVRNLKWNWPGYLTFGKNSKDKEKQKKLKGAGDEQEPDTEPESKSNTGGEGVDSPGAPVTDDIPGSDSLKEEEKVEVGIEVDAVSLADAIESENIGGGSSNEHSPGICTPSEAPPSPATSTIGPIPDDSTTPTVVQPADPIPVSQEIEETPQQSTSTDLPSLGPEELPPTTSGPLPPPVTFSQTFVHLAPPEHPLRTTKRRLYYLTVRRPSRVLISRSDLEVDLIGTARKRTSPLLWLTMRV